MSVGRHSQQEMNYKEEVGFITQPSVEEEEVKAVVYDPVQERRKKLLAYQDIVEDEI